MSHRASRSVRNLTIALWALLAVPGLAGCTVRMTTPDHAPIAATTPHIIPVSIAVSATVLLQAAPLGDAPAQAVYALVVNDNDWDRLAGQIPEAALQAGRQASAAGHAVVVAFAGAKGSSGYQVNLRKATLQADELTITVAVTAPGADDIVEPASTLPFVLAIIPRDALATIHSYVFVDEGGQSLIRSRITAP